MAWDIGQVFAPRDWQGWLIPLHNLTGGGGNIFDKNGADLYGRPSAPQMSPNPYQGNWQSLVTQLQRGGTPLADTAYRNASDTAVGQTAALSHGGSAGGARQAGMNLAGTQAKMGQDYELAKIQENMARQQQLQAALSGAGGQYLQEHIANLQAQMGSPTKWDMITKYLSQVGSLMGGAGG